MEPQGHPLPKDWRAHIIRVIDAIVDDDQVTTKEFVEDLIAALPDPLEYKGVWDASTNTPTLLNTDTGVTGYLYRCNVAGSVDFGAGSITFTIGDFAVNNGTIYEKWDAGDLVSSVFGRTGDIAAAPNDYTHAQTGSQTPDDHHNEDTETRMVKILYTSQVRGSDSAPNDGSMYKPFKSIQHAISIGGDRCIIYTDESAAFPSSPWDESVSIPAGQTIHINSLAGPFEQDVVPSIGTLTLNEGSTVVIQNVSINNITEAGGITSSAVYAEAGRIISVSGGANIDFYLFGTWLEANAYAKVVGYDKADGFAYLNGALVNIFCSDPSGEALDMNTKKIIRLGDPTSAQHAATKNYIDVTHSGLPSAHHTEFTDTDIDTLAKLNAILTDANLRAIGSEVNIGANSFKTTNGQLYEQSATQWRLRNALDDGFIGLYGEQFWAAKFSISEAIDYWGTAAGLFKTNSSDDAYVAFQAKDNGVGLVEVARLLGAANPGFRLGSPTDNLFVGVDGIVTLNGASRIGRHFPIQPMSFDLSAASPASRGALAGTPALLFDDTTTEEAQAAGEIEGDYDNSVNPTIMLRVAPAANQTVGSDFVFQVELRYIGEGESLNKAIDETLQVTVPVSNTQYIMKHASFTLDKTKISSGDHVGIVLKRLPGDAADDRNGDAGIVHLDVKWTANKLGD